MSKFLEFCNKKVLKEDDIDSTEGQKEDKVVEIFFNDLAEAKQKEIMDGLLNVLNATEEDDFANKKITEQLASKPLFSSYSKDLKNELGIRI